jgi:hypothetical protein
LLFLQQIASRASQEVFRISRFSAISALSHSRESQEVFHIPRFSAISGLSNLCLNNGGVSDIFSSRASSSTYSSRSLALIPKRFILSLPLSGSSKGIHISSYHNSCTTIVVMLHDFACLLSSLQDRRYLETMNGQILRVLQ